MNEGGWLSYSAMLLKAMTGKLANHHIIVLGLNHTLLTLYWRPRHQMRWSFWKICWIRQVRESRGRQTDSGFINSWISFI
jgi:hypothetical protein